MKSIYLLLLSFISIYATAQTPSISFQKSFGGVSNDRGVDIISLANGDFVVCGASSSGISGDKTANSYGGYDYWIFQITATGSIVWQTTIGGIEDDIPSAIIPIMDGGFLITGYSNSPASGNKNSDNYGSDDVWVVKLSSAGVLEWDKSFGGTSSDIGASLVLLSNGYYYLGNYSWSGSNGNKTVDSKGGSDFWGIVIDDLGNVINQFVYGGDGEDLLFDVSVYDNSHILLTGISNSIISGDKNEAPFGEFDQWVLLCDLVGNVISSTTQGGTGFDGASNAVVNSNKNVWVFGYSDSSSSGSKTATNYGFSDFWVVSLDSNLNKIGDFSFGGDRGDIVFNGSPGILYGPTNGCIIAGVSTSEISGNKLTPSFNKLSDDIWVIGIDDMGNKTFEFVAGGSKMDQAFSLIETVNNTICIIGHSYSGISGNKTVPSKGLFDVWIFELDFNLSVDQVVVENELQVYPNPTRTVVNFSLPMISSNARVSLTDLTGKVVYENVINGLSKSQIDVSHLPAGMYVLNVNSTEFKYNRKVIIE